MRPELSWEPQRWGCDVVLVRATASKSVAQAGLSLFNLGSALGEGIDFFVNLRPLLACLYFHCDYREIAKLSSRSQLGMSVSVQPPRVQLGLRATGCYFALMLRCCAGLSYRPRSLSGPVILIRKR